MKPNSLLASMLILSYCSPLWGLSNVDLLDKVDIDAEYKLIQQKKSRLSANLRRRVVSIYESRQEVDSETL